MPRSVEGTLKPPAGKRQQNDFYLISHLFFLAKRDVYTVSSSLQAPSFQPPTTSSLMIHSASAIYSSHRCSIRHCCCGLLASATWCDVPSEVKFLLTWISECRQCVGCKLLH